MVQFGFVHPESVHVFIPLFGLDSRFIVKSHNAFKIMDSFYKKNQFLGFFRCGGP